MTRGAAATLGGTGAPTPRPRPLAHALMEVHHRVRRDRPPYMHPTLSLFTKLFIYINDVADTGGPTAVVPGSHLAPEGPTRAAARLEGSKAFARLLMRNLDVPTPRFGVCDNADRARPMARRYPWARVFKADGIAYGKGVRVTHSLDEVDEAIETVLYDNIYGLESDRVVVEERIDGVEITVVTLTDGSDFVVLGHVLNHPRLFDNERGPPTRGMGQIFPAPQVSQQMLDELSEDIIRPTIHAMRDAGAPLCGALFVDLMLRHGEAYVLDYNVRFGDPATQTVLSAYQGDFYGLLQACRGGGLQDAFQKLTRDPRPRISVVVACEGYPNERIRGASIDIDDSFFEEQEDLWLYEDGVRSTDQGIETTGGRTYTLVAAADDLEEARQLVYRGVQKINFDGKHARLDIGQIGMA